MTRKKTTAEDVVNFRLKEVVGSFAKIDISLSFNSFGSI